MADGVIGRIVAYINADIRNFERGFNAAMNQLHSFDNTVTKVSTSAGIALAGIGAAGVHLIKVASDAQEMQNVLDTSFGKMSKDVTAWAETTANQMGRSRYQMKEFASNAMAMIKPMAKNADVAAEMSKGIAQLSFNLGSFRNIADDRAFEAITAALMGESEPLKRLGYVVNETALKHYALSQGITASVEKMTEGEKIGLRYNLIMKLMSDVQGDAIKTSGSFANQTKNLQASITNLSEELGMYLLPAATETVKVINDLVGQFGALDPQTKTAILRTTALVSAVLAGTVAFGLFVKGLVLMGEGIGLLMSILSFATSPMIILGVAIAAVAYLVYEAWNRDWQGIRTNIVAFANSAIEKFDAIRQWWSNNDIKSIVLNAWNELKNIWLDNTLTLPKKVIQTAEVAVKTVLLTGLELLKLALPVAVEITDLAITGVETISKNVPEIGKELSKSINDIFAGLLDWSKKNSSGVWTDVVNFGKKIAELLIEGIKGAFNITIALSDIIRSATSGLSKVLSEWSKAIGDWSKQTGNKLNIKDNFMSGFTSKATPAESFFKGIFDLGTNIGYILGDALKIAFDLGKILIAIISGAIKEIGAALINLGSQIAGEIVSGIVRVLPKDLQQRLPLNIQLLAGVDVTDIVNKDIQTLKAYQQISAAMQNKDFKKASNLFLTLDKRYVSDSEFMLKTAFSQLEESAKKAASQVEAFLGVTNKGLKNFDYSLLQELRLRVDLFVNGNTVQAQNASIDLNGGKKYHGGLMPGKHGPDQFLAMLAPGEAVVPSYIVNQGWPATLAWFQKQGVPGFYDGKAPVTTGNPDIDAINRDISNTNVFVTDITKGLNDVLRSTFTVITAAFEYVGKLIMKIAELVFGKENVESFQKFFVDAKVTFEGILNSLGANPTGLSGSSGAGTTGVYGKIDGLFGSEEKQIGVMPRIPNWLNTFGNVMLDVALGLKEQFKMPMTDQDMRTLAFLQKSNPAIVEPAPEDMTFVFPEPPASTWSWMDDIDVAMTLFSTNLTEFAQGFGQQMINELPLVNKAMQGAEQGAQAGPIGAVVGALIAIISESETFKTILSIANNMLQSLANSLGMVLEPLLPIAQIMTQILSPVLGIIGTLLSAVLLPIMKPMFEALKLVAMVVTIVAIGFYGLMYVINIFAKGVMDVLNWIFTILPGFKDMEEMTAKLSEQFGASAEENKQEMLKQVEALKNLHNMTWDQAMAQAKLTDETNKAANAMRNVPEILKIVLRRNQAADGVEAPSVPSVKTPTPDPISPVTPATPTVTVKIEGNVYGVDDLESVILGAMGKYNRQQKLNAVGLAGA